MDLIPEEKKALMDEFIEKAKVSFAKETKADVDKINKLIVDKFEELKKGNITESDFMEFKTKADTRLDELETKMNRPPIETPGTGAPEEESAENKALDIWMRKGLVGPEEEKVLRISDDTGAGYLASPEISGELLKTIVEFSNIRSIARVRPTSNVEIWVRKRTGTFAAKHVGETETKTETTGLAYGMEKIPNHELYADVIVSNQELEDSDFNLQAEIAMEAGEQFGVAEGTDFVSGDGVNKAEGFLANKEVIAGKIAGDTSGDLSVTDILNTYYGLKEAYALNATWLMRRATVQKVVLFKDSANHYIWMPSLVTAMPQTILGRPILECPDMPAVASNAYAVAFGNFRMGYTISDRLQISILRDPYSKKMQGAVEFTVRKRVGGQVVQSEAIKILKIAA
jgi:HK97 family phage major capsid protein